MLDQITPIVLAYNEAANLDRSLAKLSWAREVLLVDSGSTDATLEIAAAHPNVRVLTRPFDDFARQWNHALEHGGVKTPWVMALDADYVLTDALIDELSRLTPAVELSGFRVRFRYCIDGKPLRGSLYPPSTFLFRLSAASPERAARFRLDGHCYRLEPAPGRIAALEGYVLHDDRKPMARWLASQARYAQEEAEKLRRTPWGGLSWPDRVRRVPFLAAPAVLVHCLAVKGCALDGKAGVTYAAQRVLAELIISKALLASIATDAVPGSGPA